MVEKWATGMPVIVVKEGGPKSLSFEGTVTKVARKYATVSFTPGRYEEVVQVDMGTGRDRTGYGVGYSVEVFSEEGYAKYAAEQNARSWLYEAGLQPRVHSRWPADRVRKLVDAIRPLVEGGEL